MDIKEKFTEKAGPLPVWAWVVIVSVGGYVLYKYYENKKAANVSAQSNSAQTTPPVGSSGDTANLTQMVEDPALMEQLNNTTSDLATLATNVGKQTTATQSNTTAVQGNTNAIIPNTAAVKVNTASVVPNTAAVTTNTKAVASNTAAVAKKSIPVHRASTPAKPRLSRYRIVWGDTMTSIAARHHISLGELEKLNPQVRNPNLIYAGAYLNVPA